MAIYHFRMTPVRRRDGHSAVAAAAYRSGSRLTDERTGRSHDYSRRSGVVADGLVGWQGDRCDLWNDAEGSERHPRAIVAREIVIALPHELADGDRRALVVQFAEYLHRRHALAVDWAIHAPTPHSPKNTHAHLLITTRRLGVDGLSLAKKCRELDVADSGGAHLRHWRETWASRVNERLWLAGIKTEVNHRSHKARGQVRQPLLHLGPDAAAMERRGYRTEKGKENQRRRRRNRQLAAIDAQIFEVQRRFRDLTRATVEILTTVPPERQLVR